MMTPGQGGRRLGSLQQPAYVALESRPPDHQPAPLGAVGASLQQPARAPEPSPGHRQVAPGGGLFTGNPARHPCRPGRLATGRVLAIGRLELIQGRHHPVAAPERGGQYQPGLRRAMAGQGDLRHRRRVLPPTFSKQPPGRFRGEIFTARLEPGVDRQHGHVTLMMAPDPAAEEGGRLGAGRLGPGSRP